MSHFLLQLLDSVQAVYPASLMNHTLAVMKQPELHFYYPFVEIGSCLWSTSK